MATLSAFKGINNRLSDTALPKPSKEDPRLPLRNAVNVDLDNFGNVIFPAWGDTKVYSATDAHSWYEFEDALGYGLFVDNGSLLRLNKNNTATTLKAVQNIPMSYAALNGKVYFSNGIDYGVYDEFNATEWGVDNPPRQPDPTAVTYGNLYAGDYLIAITWLDGTGDRFRESGTYGSQSVTVAEGGGIRLTNFPTPPSYVDKVAVYVSAVNSKVPYLFNEYPASTSEVYINAAVNTVALTTQFAVKPEPKKMLTLHNGAIFWADGTLVKHTEPHAVGLYRAGNYFNLEHEVLALISIKTGPLYVQTTGGLYAISGIFGADVPARPLKVRTYDGCRLNQVAYNPDNNQAAIWTDAGFTLISADGVKDLNATEFAAPHFEKGTLAFVETNGINKLVFVGVGGTVNTLQHPDYTAAETARSGRSF